MFRNVFKDILTARSDIDFCSVVSKSLCNHEADSGSTVCHDAGPALDIEEIFRDKFCIFRGHLSDLGGRSRNLVVDRRS